MSELVNTSTVSYNSLIVQAYRHYTPLLPLDLRMLNDKKRQDFWRKTYQYSLHEFARKIKILTLSRTLDEYICTSEGDFDNLSLVIESAVEVGILSLKDSKIIASLKENYKSVEPKKIGSFIPYTDLNQFPCDEVSVKKRYRYILERYPFIDKINIAIIGEDDFLSRYTSNDKRFTTIVIEKDPKVLEVLGGLNSSKNILVHSVSIPSDYSQLNIQKVATFITDPPYTLYGSLAFITCGLSLIDENLFSTRVEFYVLLNSSMMGKQLDELLTILSNHGVYLRGVKENFSTYKLPSHYPEYRRAEQFMKLISGNKAPDYSSSSNLYRFECTNPDIHSLSKLISTKKIYEHYDKN
jgi:hypothetical protein